jgi:hypothetical protein
MTPSVPIEVVHGADEVTVWMWSNSPDPVTVRFSYHEWAKIERKAEQVAGGDVEAVIGHLLENDLEGLDSLRI